LEDIPGWTGPALLATAFLTLAAWSWRKWPDVYADAGLQLYIPWQLCAGKVLYLDIAHNRGPFSQYFNAAAFRVFGVSLTTLIFVNLAILAALTALLYRMLAQECGRLAATASCLLLLCVFSFSQYLGVGNYTFAFPYCHEATHGVALSAAMIFLLTRRQTRQGWWRSSLAGFCCGIVFLTKPETALAAAAAAALGLATLRSKRAAGLFLAAALLPSAAFLAFFWTRMPVREALRAVGSAWNLLPHRAVWQSPFYKTLLGLDRPAENLRVMAKMFGWLTAAGMAAVALDLAALRLGSGRRLAGLAAGAATFWLLAWGRIHVPWPDIGRPLPLLALGALAAALWARRGMLSLWGVFSLVLLSKMALHARLDFVGFYLAMPAALLVVACLVGLAPQVLARAADGGGRVFRCLALGACSALVVCYLRASDRMYDQKDLLVGSGEDAIVGYSSGSDRDLVLKLALKRIAALVPQDATLACLPDAAMLNYLSRRVNPTPHLQLLPFELQTRGEPAVLADFQAHPPDFIALVHSNPAEFDVGYFGTDPRNGRLLMDWIKADYEALEVVAREPFQERRFGVKLLRRRISWRRNVLPRSKTGSGSGAAAISVTK
jgi:hypothetical protein